MKRISHAILIITLYCFLAPGCRQGEKIKYPETEKIKVVEKIHGVEIIDNYRWLEDKKDPKVQVWIKEQNRLSQNILENLPQRRWLHNRFTFYSKYHADLITEKVEAGERSFRIDKKKAAGVANWFILYREKKDTPEKELVNLNRYGKNINAELSMLHPSPDGKYLLFTTEGGGKEDSFARLLEVDTEKIMPGELKGWRHYNIIWLPDNSGFYYTACPRKGEVPAGEEYFWSAVYFHKMGTPTTTDKKVFYHPSQKQHIHTTRFTKSKKFLLFERLSILNNNNEIYFKKVANKEPPKPLITGLDANYQVVEFGDKFLIRTNWKAPLSRVMITGMEKPERKYWREFIPEAKDKLDRRGIAAAGDYVFARYLCNAANKVKIFDKTGQYLRDIPFPYIGSGSAGVNEKEAGIKVVFSSYTYPISEFKYDMKTGKLTFVKQRYPLKVDVSPYITRQVWYSSRDGTKISMFLLQRKDITQDSDNPTLLHGYGGFNKSKRPWFNPDFIIWLEAGGMVAIPNLRGGGEYGKKWHEGGIGVNKQNSFDDCIAAAEWLIKNRYTNPKKLAFYGVSNGGLLAGAMAVQRPDLFKAIWSNVPFMDMVRFHKFGRSGLWIREYGNPEDPEQFAYILDYSPYHNVKDRTPYPAVLLTAGENDPRCHPLHAMKMAALLQEANGGGNPILLHVEKGAGHGTGLLLEKEINKKAKGWAFLMSHVGMTAPPKVR